MEKKYNFLRPIKNENLVRLGRNADGGYVVDKNVVENTNHLVTFGLGPDWSFELDYIKLNNICCLVDGSFCDDLFGGRNLYEEPYVGSTSNFDSL